MSTNSHEWTSETQPTYI